jgi:hypothetical protein
VGEGTARAADTAPGAGTAPGEGTVPGAGTAPVEVRTLAVARIQEVDMPL